jgi:hypothetical protein
VKNFKNVDEFIKEVFPMEYQIIIKKEKPDIEQIIKNADAEFNEKLEAIIKGENEEKKS